LRALAENTDVTAMAISKYERGKSTPSSGALLSLSKALDVPVEYFFRTAKVELREPEYRKHQMLAKKLQTKIEGDVREQVERFFELTDLLPGGPISRFQMPDGLPSGIKNYNELEGAADAVRSAWNLGSNPICAH
jgi:transcriptional regulator with XRE-family HTH domain